MSHDIGHFGGKQGVNRRRDKLDCCIFRTFEWQEMSSMKTAWRLLLLFFYVIVRGYFWVEFFFFSFQYMATHSTGSGWNSFLSTNIQNGYMDWQMSPESSRTWVNFGWTIPLTFTPRLRSHLIFPEGKKKKKKKKNWKSHPGCHIPKGRAWLIEKRLGIVCHTALSHSWK